MQAFGEICHYDISHKLQHLLTEKNIYAPRILGISLRASSPGRFGGGAGKMEGELATTSLEFEYLHRKSQCEMLIGGDDISNDVITLCTCFSMFVNIRASYTLGQ